MMLQDVIGRALTDASFAQELRDKALAGQQAGADTDEWEAFMAYFAEDAQQLAVFRSLNDGHGGCTVTLTCTMTVMSTLDCTLTTTTMTTSAFCG